MPVPLISALPTVPSYDNTNFESLAPAFLSFLKNTFQAEMNAAIAAINNYDYGAAVNANIITGQVAVPNGGTGLSTLAAGRIPYGDDTNPLESDSTFKYDSAKKILHIPAIIASRANPLRDLDSDADLYRTNNTNLFGSLSGTSKWIGGVLAPNGKIYGIPFDSTQVLEIDPVAGTTALFGSLSGTYKWYGGVLAPNGKIYGIPCNSTQVLEIENISGIAPTWELSAYLNKL